MNWTPVFIGFAYGAMIALFWVMLDLHKRLNKLEADFEFQKIRINHLMDLTTWPKFSEYVMSVIANKRIADSRKTNK